MPGNQPLWQVLRALSHPPDPRSRGGAPGASRPRLVAQAPSPQNCSQPSGWGSENSAVALRQLKPDCRCPAGGLGLANLVPGLHSLEKTVFSTSARPVRRRSPTPFRFRASCQASARLWYRIQDGLDAPAARSPPSRYGAIRSRNIVSVRIKAQGNTARPLEPVGPFSFPAGSPPAAEPVTLFAPRGGEVAERDPRHVFLECVRTLKVQMPPRGFREGMNRNHAQFQNDY